LLALQADKNVDDALQAVVESWKNVYLKSRAEQMCVLLFFSSSFLLLQV
jgi:hypothetical protein